MSLAQEPLQPFAPVNRGLLVLALVALLALTVLGPLMTEQQGLTGEGSGLRQAGYLAVVLGAVLATRPYADPRRLHVVPWPIWAALGWCWLSTAWSLDPGITMRRAALTTLVLYACFLSVRHLGYALSVAIMRWVLAITLACNFIAVVAVPDFGIHPFNMPGDQGLAGDWRGIMRHKNFAGEVSAMLIPLIVFDADRINRWARLACWGGAVVFLYFSQSKTSLGLVGFGLLAGLAYMRVPPRYRALSLAGGLVAVILVLAAMDLYRDPLRDLMRDPTAFTGRVEIWRALLAYVADHPWLGSGYGAFWNIGPASPIYSLAKGWVSEITTAHNGFLDLLVQIGIPGLVLVLVATVGWPVYRLTTAERLPGQRAGIVIALIVFCITHNTTESSLFERDMIGQVFLMLALALIAPIEAEAARMRARAADGHSFLGMRRALT